MFVILVLTFSSFFVILWQKIMAVQYKIPDYVHISQDCKHLLSRIFVATPSRVCIMLLLLNLVLNLVLITEIWVSYNVLQLSCLISLSISYKYSRRHLLKPFVLIGNYFLMNPTNFIFPYFWEISLEH